MNRIPLSPITAAFVQLFFLLRVTVTTPVASAEALSNCSSAFFNCGTLGNVSYPFTGGDRPAHCGPPEFLLTCVGDSPELAIASLGYRVLGLDPVRRILTLARLDLWNETCPEKVVNTTLGSTTVFREANNTSVNIFYGCTSFLNMTRKAANMFQCDNKKGPLGDAYFWVGPILEDAVLRSVECRESLTVPILESWALKLETAQAPLAEALMGGFDVNYSLPNDDAAESSLKRNLIIGTSAAVVGILIIAVVLLCIYKRTCLSFKAILHWKKDEQEEFDVEAFLRNYVSHTPKRYSYSNIKKMTNSFSNVIGKGGYGCVYKGRLPDGQAAAVKVLKGTKSNGEDFINEVASIGRTSHVNVVSLLGFCYERTKRALVYEYMPNGSLEKFILNQEPVNTTRCLGWKATYEIALGIARGLEYLHCGCNTRILHFDIKPQNILLDKDFCPKISDFGLAKLWLNKESIVSILGARGTAGYIAPEVFSRNFGGSVSQI